MPVFCGTELRFGSLCNQVLPKTLRFSLQRHKTPEFGEAEFSDCLPVFALECFSAFDTGGLWLWLGAFEKSRLYRCQSTPGPPMPCFVAQSFVLASKKPSLVQLPCAKTREFGEAEFSDFGLGLLRSQGFIGAKAPLDPLCRFFVAQSFVLAAFATLVCQRNCGFSLQRHKT